MENNLLKKKIAYLIGSRSSFNYEHNLQYIFDNEYKCITKVPLNLIRGIIDTVNIKDISLCLKLIKEVITEALELSGIELTFVDTDWDDLNLTVNQDNDWDVKYNYKRFNTKKLYLGEFFDR